MRAPLEQLLRYIWSKKTILSFLLLPFSIIYLAAHYLKFYLKKPIKVDAKVICVGNLSVGGAGKTSFCIALHDYIKNHDHDAKVAFISKGYRSIASTNKVITVKEDTAILDCGDEPKILAQVSDTFVSKNRVAACQYAVEQGYEILILDDGFSDNSIHKDCSILLFSDYSYGNMLPLPAGPLRELLCFAQHRIDYVVTNCDNIPFDKPLIEVETHYSLSKKIDLSSSEILAFCGIGDPSSFEQALHEVGVINYQLKIFDNHHVYNNNDFKFLESAIKRGNILITTQKDAIKLPEYIKNALLILNKLVAIKNDTNPSLFINNVL
jgi:tetraacyldisaccharide 4'-kinase